jgi:hypothetical protein
MLDLEYLKSYVGKTWNRKTELDLDKFRFENRMRQFSLQPLNCVVVCNNQSKNEIKGIGVNKPHDLIMDNFGIYFASLFKVVNNTLVQISIKNVAGTSRNLSIWTATATTAYYNAINANKGCKLKIGEGGAAVLRTQTALNNDFDAGNEANYISISTNTYNSAVGVATYQGVVIASNSGDILESGFFMDWYQTSTGAVETFMMSREILNEAIPFVSGDPILVKYDWLLS